MKHFTLIIAVAALLFPAILCAQVEMDPARSAAPAPADSSNMIVFVVDEQASFPGGNDAMMRFLAKNLKYPDTKSEGVVYVEFTIEQDGRITNVHVVKSDDPALNQAAIDVVEKMPKFKPGKQKGKAVRTKYVLPIKFALNL